MSVREHHPAAEANVVVLHEVVVPHLLDVVAVVITLPGRMSVAIVTMIVVTEIVLAAQMIGICSFQHYETLADQT